ncbi:ABC transporter substrate-binding protein [Streptomyces cyaneofuscatus]|uniref:ABC transporter substrate-binding protein n=1 Tax=Streptomyces cyaneofuscatus TaxID=66883 RepID=UPI0034203F28
MSAHIKRRTALLGLGIGASTALLSGCLPGDRSSSAAPRKGNVTPPGGMAPGPVVRGPVRRGGRVITSWAEEALTYDPALGWDYHAWEAISTVLNTPLLQLEGDDGGPAPSAAAALPTVSADGRTYTIRLRPDVRFHHGRPVVAEDYVYAWTRVLDPDLASWASSVLFNIQGARAFNAGKAERVVGLQRLDDHTLRVRLEDPDITFLHTLCQPYMAALPREEIKRLGKDFARKPVGTGPFMIDSYDSSGRKAVFRRNPHYFWSGTPFIDTVEYRWGTTSELGLLQLRKGQTDALGDGVPSSLAPQIRADPSLGRRFTKEVPILGTGWLAINFNRPEMRDRRVRQALNYATDRENLLKLTYGTEDPWGLPLPRDLPSFERTATPYGYDPDRARSLLREAGTPKLRLKYLYTPKDPWVNVSQVLQQQWQEVGIELDLDLMSESAFDEATSAKQGDLYPTQWIMVMPNALDLAGQCYASDGSSNYTGYGHKKVDALLTQARRQPDEKRCNGLLAQAEELLTEDAPGVFLSSKRFVTARSPRIGDFHARGETGTYYDRLWVG